MAGVTAPSNLSTIAVRSAPEASMPQVPTSAIEANTTSRHSRNPRMRRSVVPMPFMPHYIFNGLATSTLDNRFADVGTM